MSGLNRHGYSDEAWSDDHAARIERDLDRAEARGAAAHRVQAFLAARGQMGGPIHPDIIYEVWVAGEQYQLTVADLQALVGS